MFLQKGIRGKSGIRSIRRIRGNRIGGVGERRRVCCRIGVETYRTQMDGQQLFIAWQRQRYSRVTGTLLPSPPHSRVTCPARQTKCVSLVILVPSALAHYGTLRALPLTTPLSSSTSTAIQPLPPVHRHSSVLVLRMKTVCDGQTAMTVVTVEASCTGRGSVGDRMGLISAISHNNRPRTYWLFTFTTRDVHTAFPCRTTDARWSDVSYLLVLKSHTPKSCRKKSVLMFAWPNDILYSIRVGCYLLRFGFIWNCDRTTKNIFLCVLRKKLNVIWSSTSSIA